MKLWDIIYSQVTVRKVHTQQSITSAVTLSLTKN